tara:strand:- start:992 stop:2266 length:1275 start_codon:yes stop_codon:yes gene_type:complete
MSKKWPGGIINKTAPTITAPTDGEGGSTSGIWTISEVMVHEKADNWPKPNKKRELWGFGRNSKGELGLGATGGDGETQSHTSPLQVGSLTDWAQVAMGGEHSIATKTDGTLWSWGYNSTGQLGQNNTTQLDSPNQVGSLTNWGSDVGPSGDGNTQISCQNGASHMIKSDGTLWSVGRGSQGQLGMNNTTIYSSPVQVGSLTNWRELAVCGGRYFMHSIKTDGTLWAWGTQTTGQLGDGSTTARSSPVQIGSVTTWVTVACGYSHTLAVKADGTLWAVGQNDNGQLGDGSTTNRSSLVQIGSLTNWKFVAAGDKNSLAVKTDGTLWGWGDNGVGALGDGSTTNRSSPVQIGSLTTWRKVFMRQKNAGSIKSDGTLWSWGYNDEGILGIGAGTNRSSPVQVGTATNWLSGGAGEGTSNHSLYLREG